MSLFEKSSSKEDVPAASNKHDTSSVTQAHHPPQVVARRMVVNNPYAKAPLATSSSSSSSSVAVHRTTIKATNPYLRQKRASVPIPSSATMTKVRTPNVSDPIHNNNNSSNSASFRMDVKDGTKVLDRDEQKDTRRDGLSDMHRNHHHNTNLKQAPPTPTPTITANHVNATAKTFSNETPVWKRLASRNLSFGSAELVTVTELYHHMDKSKNNMMENRIHPPLSSVRVTGKLLAIHGTVLLLGDPMTPPHSSSQPHVHHHNNNNSSSSSNPSTTHMRASKSLRHVAATTRPCRTSLLGKKRKLVVSTKKGGGGLGATAPSNLASSHTGSSHRNPPRPLSTTSRTIHNRAHSLSDRTTRIVTGSVDHEDTAGVNVPIMGGLIATTRQPCVAIQISTSDMLRGSVVGDYLMIVGEVRTVMQDTIGRTLLERMALELAAHVPNNKEGTTRTTDETTQVPPPPPFTTRNFVPSMESSSSMAVPGTDTEESCHEEQDANPSSKSSSSLSVGQETDFVGGPQQQQKIPKNHGRTGFYVQARILRNANGTNMNLLDQALQMRRTYFEQTSSHTTTNICTAGNNSPNHNNSAPPEKEAVSSSSPSSSTTKIHSIFETNIIL